MTLNSDLSNMKIVISPEIIGDLPSEEVNKKLFETIEVLFNEFGTVPEFGSKIEVDLFKFLFEFTMKEKIYSYDFDTLNIRLVFEKTNEVI